MRIKDLPEYNTFVIKNKSIIFALNNNKRYVKDKCE